MAESAVSRRGVRSVQLARVLRAFRVVVAATLLTTCGTDTAMGPGIPVQSAVDLTGLLRAGGPIPIPIDTVLVELRRVSDSSVAFTQQVDVSRFLQQGNDLILSVALALRTTPEQFYLFAEARGGGVVYYTVRSTVTATAGQSSQTPSLVPTYVGPGSTADSVVLTVVPSSVAAGDSALATAVVYDNDAPVVGAPVGIVPADTVAVRTHEIGVNTVWLVAPATGTGSTPVTATTPTGLITLGQFDWAAGAGVSFVTVLPATLSLAPTQTSQYTATAYDALNNIISGLPVTWNSSNLAAATVSTTGLVTAVAVGSSTISATIGGVPGTSTLTVATGASGAATVIAASATSQSVTVNQLVAAVPSVTVRDSSVKPLAGVTVTFAITAGAGSITGGTATTDSVGVATLGSWRAGTVSGANTLTATVSGLTPVIFTATGLPTAVTTVAQISGNAQTDSANFVLPLPLIAEVRDSFNNPVPGVPATWSATDGSVAPAVDTSDAAGQVQGTWTLGATQANPTVTVVAAGAQTSFSATTLFGQPTILLSFAGIPGVGVGLTSLVYLDLNQAAPAGGLVVSLVSGNTSFFTVPATRTIPQGQTHDSVAVTGLSAGTAALTGSASGYTNGMLTVDVQNRNVSVPGTVNVPYGQTSSLPITLPAPAPVGGVAFTVTSADPTRVGILTPTVTIAAGASTGNATLSGVLPGTAVVTVANPSYVSATSSATTTASLNITVPSILINASFASPITINFESNNTPAAAPAPGITVTLVPANPACVAPQSPVTIGTGLVTATSLLSYGGSATLPCTTQVLATATNLQSDSITVTVNPMPPITVNTNFDQVGQGLMEAGSIGLGATNHGGVTVTLTSSDPTRFLVSTSPSVVGASSITVPVLPLVGSFTYYAQALEGVTGTAVITATAPGFAPVPDTLTVVVPGIELQGLPATTTSLSTDNSLYAQVGLVNGQLTALSRVQNVRPGGPVVAVTFGLQSTGVGTIIDSLTTPTGAQSGQARLRPGLYYTQTGGPTAGGILFHPVAAGFDSVGVSAPGFISMANATRGIQVTQPTITLSVNSPQIGVGLQEGAQMFLSASQHGGATVTLTSLDPTVVLLDTLVNGPGHTTIVKTLPNGQTGLTYYAQVVEFSQFLSVSIVATEPRFAPDTIVVTAAQPGVELIGLPTTTTTLTGNNNLYAQVGLPNGQNTGLARVQNVRGGAPGPVPVTFTSQPTGVGTLVDSLTQPTGTDTVTAFVQPAIYYSYPSGPITGRGVAFRPLTAGRDTLSVFASGYTTMTTNGIRTIDVTQPVSTININSLSIASGLQEAGGAFLSASQHGGATVTLTSTNPSAFLIDTLSNGPGYTTIVKTLPNGSSSFTYYAQALESQTGSSYVRMSEPRFASDSVLMTAVVGGVEIQGLPGSTTPLSADNSFYVQIGLLNGQNTGLVRVQNRRGGASGVLTATLTSSVPSVATIVDSLSIPNGNATGTARIAQGIYYTPTSGPATGGLGFHPLLLGTTTVSATLPGFITATTNGVRTVGVTQPGITLSVSSGGPVGSGLQESGSGSLGASQHGGTTVTLTSSDSTAIKLAPNTTTAGAASIQIFVPDGQQGFSYYVQGMEGFVSPSTVTVTAVASGFTNGTASATVQQPAIEVQQLGGPYTAGGADVNFYAQIGLANAQNSALIRVQNVRAGGPGPINVSFTSSSVATATLVDSTGTGSPRTAQIPPGLYYTSPSGTAQGGVAFRPLVAGQSTVSASSPGFLTMTSSGNRVVTVQ